EKITGVVNIHHIHIWNVGENDIHFQAHINVDDIKVSETKPFVNEIEHLLLKKFKINHVTIQFENECCKNVGPIHEGE
ncbi:MAG: cation transporter, partial [Calditrichia bacterium]|nr:cation transporter [Calditrichia bacterium]